MIKMTWIGH